MKYFTAQMARERANSKENRAKVFWEDTVEPAIQHAVQQGNRSES